MNLRAYKATGAVMTAVLKLLRVKLRVTGVENLVQRPTLFNVNHFTRSETVLIPYILFKYGGQRFVRSLATPAVFSGLLGRYLQAVGVMSIKHPRRNRTIIRQLMTGERDWIIYPEGGIIKNKKTLDNGRLHLTHPNRTGPPHTGAAMLALKSEIIKRRYRRAWERSDRERIEYYRRAYGITSPSDLSREDTVVVPVSITYHGIRSGSNALSRLVSRLKGPLDPRLLEELLVEGTIVLSRPEVNVHFGKPIEVSDYLNRRAALARGIVGLFSESRQEEVGLRQPARRLTDASMRRLYGSTEVNLEHLFCAGLRACREGTIAADHFRRALYLAAMELRDREDVRLHPLLRNGISRLITDRTFEPLDDMIELAQREGVLRLDNGHFVIDHEALGTPHDFHEIRLRSMVQVIANEIEPVGPALQAVQEAVTRSQDQLREEVSRTIRVADRRLFHQDYARFYREGVSKPAEYGEPFFLEGEDGRIGVVLVHGYLACPEQVRPLGDALHGAGCSVYGVRLAGHGAAPEALHEVRWRDWLHSVGKGYAALETRCEQVFLVGFSLGGLMSLILASGRVRRVDGIVSINAPLRLRDKRASLVPLVVEAGSALRRLGLVRTPAYRSHSGESPELSYEVDYLSGVREVRRAIGACRRHLWRVEAPTLVIQSRRDPIISSASARMIARRVGPERCELFEVPMDHHLIVRGEGSEAVIDRTCEFIDEIAGTRPETPKGAPADGPSDRPERKRSDSEHRRIGHNGR